MNSFFPNSMEGINVEADDDSVAIIMRTCNRPVLLVRALASVLQQSHQNWRLYLVNDGGDQSVLEDILKDYRTAFGDRLVVIHHETNQGMETASNSALKQLKGGFVIVHDDDDSWHPSFLQKTTAFLNAPENHCYAAVIANCEVISEKLQDNHIVEKNRTSWGYFRKNIAFSELLFTNSAPPICFLIRKSVVDRVGHYNDALPVLGDWDYILRVIQVGDIGTIDEVLAYYHHRINSNNSAYNNTVTAGAERHEKYNVLYTNALIRAFVKKDPEAIGLLRLIMLKGDEKIEVLQKQNEAQFEELKRYIKQNSFFGKLKNEYKRLKRKYRLKK